jgi:hypothetical protein
MHSGTEAGKNCDVEQERDSERAHFSLLCQSEWDLATERFPDVA